MVKNEFYEKYFRNISKEGGGVKLHGQTKEDKKLSYPELYTLQKRNTSSICKNELTATSRDVHKYMIFSGQQHAHAR